MKVDVLNAFLKKAKQHFAVHWLAFVCACLAAGIVAAPAIIAPVSLGHNYKGIPFLYQDSEYRYLTRIHEVLDGHPSLGSPMVAEYKNEPIAFAPTGEYIYAVLSLLLFSSLSATVLVAKFIFPLILFLLVYFLVRTLVRDRGLATPTLTGLMAASLVVLGYEFADISRFFSIWKTLSPVFYISLWTRLVNPITGALFFFGFLIALRGVLRGTKYVWLVAGVLLGLMTGYIFSFSLAVTTAIVLGAYLLCVRRYRVAARVAGAVCVGAAINLFQFSGFVRSLTAASGEEFALRGGLLLTHEPLVSKVFVAAALVWLLACIVPRWMKRVWTIHDTDALIGSSILSVFIVMNQQIVTEKTVWPQHFVQYTIPLAMILLSLAVSAVLTFASSASPKLLRVGKIAVSLIILLCFVFGVRTITSYKKVAADFADRQRYAEVFAWLNSNAPQDCAVFAVEKIDELADMVPAFTHCNVYHTSFVFVALPRDRIVHNYFSWLRFRGLSAADSSQYFASHTAEARELLFADWKELYRTSTDPWLTRISDRTRIDRTYDALAPVLAKEYQQFMRGDFYDELKKYRLDYVVWDRAHDPEWNPARFPFLRPVFASADVFLYEVVAPRR